MPYLATNKKTDAIFFYLLILTAFFLLLELSFFVQCNSAYLSDFTFVSREIHIPWRIWPGILFFIAAQLFLHLAYCVVTLFITRILSNFFKLASTSIFKLGIGLWVLGITTILFANGYYFPNSKFADLVSLGLPPVFFAYIFIFFAVIYLGIVAFVVGLVVMRWFASGWGKSLLIAMVACTLLILFKPFFGVSPSTNAATKAKPNIIIIGLDSVRPDFVGYFNGSQTTPFIDNFLNNATVFSEALTPLARTFPSWVGILTGQYPKQNHIRYNLSEPQTLDLSDALPTLLHRAGYKTIFATDETRFSNIDKDFNFDQVVIPPIGLNDFLLGTFNDFPLSNLVVNTPVGKWLFPYSYGNRAAYVNYQPQSFLNLVEAAISRPSTKPLFMAIHFCLPHYPYVWANYPLKNTDGIGRYRAAVQAADQQVQQLWNILKQNHLLDNAIVVLLSDHGEALALAGDRVTEKDLYVPGVKNIQKIIPEFYPAMLDEAGVNQSVGHGTDVLGFTQYHTLLAFQLYGVATQGVKAVPGVVSLLDIKPTVLSLLNLPYKTSAGFSRAEILQGKTHQVSPQHFFIESDYSPAAIRRVYPDTKEVLLEGAKYFRVDPISTRLFVKKEMATMILGSKQYAHIDGDWVLALYPQAGRIYQPILVNLKTGLWTDDLTSTFAQNSPALSMFEAMKQFYSGEIDQSLV